VWPCELGAFVQRAILVDITRITTVSETRARIQTFRSTSLFDNEANVNVSDYVINTTLGAVAIVLLPRSGCVAVVSGQLPS